MAALFHTKTHTKNHIGKRIFVFLCALVIPATSLALDPPHVSSVKRFIEAVESGDKQSVLELTSLPIRRATPIPPIETADDFLDRYDQLFDEDLVEALVLSNIEEDWEDLAWRGIMFDDGLLWLDVDGKLRSLNYQSIEEAELQNQLLAEDRARIHALIKDYQSLVLDWQTQEHRIRIDEIASDQYRLAIWPAGTDPPAKPQNRLFTNGTIQFDGSGGNHYFEFEQGDHRYICYVFELSEASQDTPGDFVVYRNGELLFDDPVIKVYH